MKSAPRRPLPSGMQHPVAITTAVKQLNEALKIRSHARYYVERYGDRYRWSIASGGGFYPLLREVAAYMDIDYRRLILGFDTVGKMTIVAANKPSRTRPDAWTMIALADAPLSQAALVARLR